MRNYAAQEVKIPNVYAVAAEEDSGSGYDSDAGPARPTLRRTKSYFGGSSTGGGRLSGSASVAQDSHTESLMKVRLMRSQSVVLLGARNTMDGAAGPGAEPVSSTGAWPLEATLSTSGEVKEMRQKRAPGSEPKRIQHVLGAKASASKKKGALTKATKQNIQSTQPLASSAKGESVESDSKDTKSGVKVAATLAEALKQANLAKMVPVFAEQEVMTFEDMSGLTEIDVKDFVSELKETSNALTEAETAAVLRVWKLSGREAEDRKAVQKSEPVATLGSQPSTLAEALKQANLAKMVPVFAEQEVMTFEDMSGLTEIDVKDFVSELKETSNALTEAETAAVLRVWKLSMNPPQPKPATVNYHPRYNPLGCPVHKGKLEKWPCTFNGMTIRIRDGPECKMGDAMAVSELYEYKKEAVLDIYYPKSETVPDGPWLLERVPWQRLELCERAPERVSQLRTKVNGSCLPETLHQMFVTYGNRPCIGVESKENRKLPSPFASRFIWTTFQESHKRVLGCANALSAAGVRLGDFVGTCAANSRAYVEVQWGILMGGFVSVPLSVTLSESNLKHIILESGLTVAFVSPEYRALYDRFAKEILAETGRRVTLLPLTEAAVEGWAKRVKVDSMARALPEVALDAEDKNDGSSVTGRWRGQIVLPGRSDARLPVALRVYPMSVGKATSALTAPARWQVGAIIQELKVTCDGVTVGIESLISKQNKEMTAKAQSEQTLPRQLPRLLLQGKFDSKSRTLTGRVFLGDAPQSKQQSEPQSQVKPIGSFSFELVETLDPSDGQATARSAGDWSCVFGCPLSKAKDSKTSKGATLKETQKGTDIKQCSYCDEKNAEWACSTSDCPCGSSTVCQSCHSTLHVCSRGHPVVRYKVGSAVPIECDLCLSELYKGTPAFGCVLCDFDSCVGCTGRVAGKTGLPQGVLASDTRSLRKAALHKPRIILYTSGSTGRPKGAIMSDLSVNTEVLQLKATGEWNGSEVGIFDSPAAVSSSLYNNLGYLMNAGRIFILEDLSAVFDYCEAVGPSSLGMVPQKWNVLFKRYQVRLRGGEAKLGLDAEFKTCLGWRVFYLNCGGATPFPAVQRWLKRTFPQCVITENYAATECGGITNSRNDEYGVIKPGIEVRLEDWGQYKTTDKPYPRGEILVKTNLRASGYLNRPDLTAKAWDKDGFYHTGDIGELLDAKHIRVIDRKKNIFKLANGEWVSPENVEKVFAVVAGVDQVFVHGTSRHSRVIAVVVIKKESKTKADASQGDSTGDSKDGAGRPLRSAKDVISAFKRAGLDAKLRHFEVPGAVHIVSNRFLESNGMLTQSGKLCRWKIREIYATHIKTMLDAIATEDAEAAEKAGDRMGAILRRAFVGKPDRGDEQAWSDVSWDSVSVMLTQGYIEAHWGVRIPISRLLKAKESPDKLAAAIQAAKSGTNKPEPLVKWAEEAKLPADIVPTASSSLADAPAPGAARDILLTGATGFLGSAVLAELVRRSPSPASKGTALPTIICLVRPKKGHDAEARLKRALERRGYWSTPHVQSLWSQGRLTCVVGDLSKPRLGLSDNDYKRIVTRVGEIWHVGSLVNHKYDYGALRAANVGGTTEVLRLARKANAPPAAVHYVSTISVLTAKNGDENTVSDSKVLGKMGGYAQSKWVAEARVREAARRGAVPCTIHRPGLLGPDTATGAANTNDWLIRFVSGAIMIGGYRIFQESKSDVPYLHLCPVDHAASVTVSLGRHYAKLDKTCRTFHTPITVRMRTRALLAAVSQSPDLLNRRMREYGGREWAMTMDELPQNNPIFPFRKGFKRGLGEIQTHNDKLTVRAALNAMEQETKSATGAPRALLARLTKLMPYSQEEIGRMVKHLMIANRIIGDVPLLVRTNSLGRKPGPDNDAENSAPKASGWWAAGAALVQRRTSG